MKLYRNCHPSRVLALLAASSVPMASPQVADALGMRRQRAIDVLTPLERGGMVKRERVGRRFEYVIAKTGLEYVEAMGVRHVVEPVAGNNQSVEHAPEPEAASDVQPEPEAVSPVRSED